MSNARKKARTPAGSEPAKVARPQQAAAAAPMGAFLGAKRAQDDLRSKLRKFTETYKSLCDDDLAEGRRFRVRAEILPNGEDYITIEMGCNVPGIIAMPWSERSSSEVEIRYGSQLERYRSVLTMVRRSNDRLGYQIDAQGAVAMLRDGAAEGQRLLLSNKDYNKLPRSLRDPREGGVPVGNPPTGRYAPSGNTGYYQRADAEAASVMRQQYAARHRSWSDEMNEEALRSNVRDGSGQAPTSSQRAGRQEGHGSRVKSETSQGASSDAEEGDDPPPRGPGTVPVPTTQAVRRAPPPSSSGAGGSRGKAPAPSTTG